MLVHELLRAASLLERSGLSAGLVAWTWQLMLHQDLPDSPLTLEMSTTFAVGVMVLYLVDRTWDERRAVSCWRIVAMAVLAALAAPGLVGWWGACPGKLVALALMVGGYYAVRFVWPDWQRGRAVIVGGIFAIGVSLPGGVQSWWLYSSIGLLFTANVALCGAANCSGARLLLLASALCGAFSPVSAWPVWIAALLMVPVALRPLLNPPRAMLADAALWIGAGVFLLRW